MAGDSVAGVLDPRQERRLVELKGDPRPLFDALVAKLERRAYLEQAFGDVRQFLRTRVRRTAWLLRDREHPDAAVREALFELLDALASLYTQSTVVRLDGRSTLCCGIAALHLGLGAAAAGVRPFGRLDDPESLFCVVSFEYEGEEARTRRAAQYARRHHVLTPQREPACVVAPFGSEDPRFLPQALAAID